MTANFHLHHLPNTKLLLPGLALLASLAACGGGSGFTAEEIIEQTPTGSIEGTPFTMITAEIDAGSDSFSVSLYGESLEACGFASPSTGSIIFSVPRVEGEYPLKLDFGSAANQTITFVEPPSNNIIATEGMVTVESITDTEVTIGLVAEAGGSSINGRFTATLCPSDS